MWLIELIMDILGLFADIQIGRRYGWGSFKWDLASFACLIVAVLFLSADLHILGTLGIIGCVACFVMGCRRLWQDMKSQREYEAWKREQENIKES